MTPPEPHHEVPLPWGDKEQPQSPSSHQSCLSPSESVNSNGQDPPLLLVDHEQQDCKIDPNLDLDLHKPDDRIDPNPSVDLYPFYPKENQIVPERRKETLTWILTLILISILTWILT